MKKWILLIIMVLAAGLMVRNSSCLAGAEEDMPPTITISNGNIYKQSIKGPVSFPHARHYKEFGISCRNCHHRYEDKENQWQPGDPVSRCQVCHPLGREPGIAKLQTAYHHQCRNCHRDFGVKPYKKCSGCHGRTAQ